MALPQQHRLRGPRPFDRLYRQGRRHQGEWLVLRSLPARHSLLSASVRGRPVSDWRCGVVVSSKVHRRAVRRNRLRRLLHAELMRDPPRPRQPIWLLFSLRPGAADADEALLLGECRQLLHKAGLTR